jgi:hypothetical protein
MAWIREWVIYEDTGRRDKYGPIVVQRGVLVSGVAMFRRRRERNKNRYMYWCEGGKVYSERFDAVLAEAQALTGEKAE